MLTWMSTPLGIRYAGHEIKLITQVVCQGRGRIIPWSLTWPPQISIRTLLHLQLRLVDEVVNTICIEVFTLSDLKIIVAIAFIPHYFRNRY